jgi:hypothetical protein
MTTDLAKPLLRLRSPSDIVEAVPYLIGFQPEDSLVVVSLRGERLRVGLTARVDLPPAESAESCAREFVGYLKRDNAVRAVVVFYPPSGGPSYPSVRPIADAFTKHLKRSRIAVADVLCVSERRWWSLHCTDADCCPPGGTPVSHGATSVTAVTMAVAGQVVLSSRAELERTIAPVGGVVEAAMAYALPRADISLASRLMTGQRGAVTGETLELFGAIVNRRMVTEPGAGDRRLSVDDAARLIVGLEDVQARDEVIGWFEGAWGDATRDLVTELVRHALPPWDVPAMTVFAWISYLQGNGALAGMALERALVAEPDYYLAQLLEQALRGALNPEVFRSLYNAPRLSGYANGPSNGANG